MAVQKNSVGVSHARSLINAGKVNTTASWSISSADKRAILGDPQNYTEYKRWFLGVDTSANKETMGAYKYPFGKRGRVYRSALIAIRQRAAAQNATSIFEAAGTLLELIESKDNATMSGKLDRINTVFREIVPVSL